MNPIFIIFVQIIDGYEEQKDHIRSKLIYAAIATALVVFGNIALELFISKIEEKWFNQDNLQNGYILHILFSILIAISSRRQIDNI
jgi:hypothetical protein